MHKKRQQCSQGNRDAKPVELTTDLQSMTLQALSAHACCTEAHSCSSPAIIRSGKASVQILQFSLGPGEGLRKCTTKFIFTVSRVSRWKKDNYNC